MWFLIGLVGVAAAILLLRPPKQEALQPAEDEGNTPKVTEGDVLGRLYGTMWIKDPQVHWYGDARNEAIRKKGGKK